MPPKPRALPFLKHGLSSVGLALVFLSSDVLANPIITSVKDFVARQGESFVVTGTYAKSGASCLTNAPSAVTGITGWVQPSLTATLVDPITTDDYMSGSVGLFLEFETPCAPKTNFTATITIPQNAKSGTTKSSALTFFEYGAGGNKTFTTRENITLTIPQIFDKAPYASDVLVSTTPGTPVSVDLSYKPITAQLDKFVITKQPKSGSASIAGKRLTYTPHPNADGLDTLSFAAVNSYGQGSPATATINLIPQGAGNSYYKLFFAGEDYGKSSIDLEMDSTVNIIHSFTSTWGTTCTSGELLAWNVPKIATETLISVNGGPFEPPSLSMMAGNAGCSNNRIAYWPFTANSIAPILGRSFNAGDVIVVKGHKQAFIDRFNSSSSVYYDGHSENTLTIRLIPKRPKNTAPTAHNSAVNIDEDTKGLIDLSAEDPDAGDSLTFKIINQPNVGTAFISGGKLVFNPPPNWNGITSLTFMAIDSKGAESNTATITINVLPVNDPPVVTPRNLILAEDTIGKLLLTATDIDSSAFNYEILEQPDQGYSSIIGSTLTYTPPADWFGETKLKYRAKDDSGAWSLPAIISITVTPVNDPPAASSLSLSLQEDTSGEVTLRATDIDSPQNFVFELVDQSPSAIGTASIQGDHLLFKPAKDWNGTVTIGYKAKDLEGAWSDIAHVKITVTPVNDQPIQAGKLVIRTTEGVPTFIRGAVSN